MALMSPVTTEADIDRHTTAFDEGLRALFAQAGASGAPVSSAGWRS
jgi:hypothetical protein